MTLGRLLVPLAGFIAAVFVARAHDSPADAVVKLPLQFSEGHNTDPVDHGRPVVLIAAALGVPEQVFRETFRHVHPAPTGDEPKPEDVRQNKQELLSRLAKYGVTNERLDEVSNYYRYRPESMILWRHVDAAGYAFMRGNKVVWIEITQHGAGYSTPPLVSVKGVGLTQYLCAQLEFSKDLTRNGSVATITPSALGDSEKGYRPMTQGSISNVHVESSGEGISPAPVSPQPPPSH